MLNLSPTRFIAVMVMIFSTYCQAQPSCQGDWINAAVSLDGLVFGTNEYRAAVTDNLAFTLQPDQSGWDIIMENANGVPIPTALQPRGITAQRGNARSIQRFVFGPTILDPAQNPERTVPANQPPNQPANLASVEAKPGSRGSGWLIINEQGFDDANPARAVYMEFQACVNWNTGPREPNDDHYGDLGAPQAIANWVVTAFEDCGLPTQLLLTDRMAALDSEQRAWLEPDFDGDGRVDLVALVERFDNGRKGLGICLQKDKTLSVLGLDTDITNIIESDYLSEVNWWVVDGRGIALGIEGASNQDVYLDDEGNFVSRWLGD